MSKHRTIGELAEATGVSAATLRAWEKRHGFPRPTRGGGGQRRYGPEDVQAVRAVVANRAAGMSLPAAIARAAATGNGVAASLFAALRESSAVTPQEVSRRTMSALSRALEDECAARAERGILVGAFQQRRFFDRVSHRWRDLANGARYTVVLADFARASNADARPARVPIPLRSPLEREWAIAHLAPRSSVVLLGREMPGSAPGLAERRFELVWSAEPEFVARAVEGAAAMADRAAPPIGTALRKSIQTVPPSSGPDPEFVTALTTRMVAYLDR